MRPTTPETINNAGAPRKTYESPRLERYGNIQQITQALGSEGAADGAAGGKGMNKTG